jgi:hypothetical protein
MLRTCFVLLTLQTALLAADPPAPVPIPVQPVAKIDGPVSGVVGDHMKFNAYQCEGARVYKWSIFPEGTQGLEIADGGKRVLFSNRNPGEYMLLLSIGSDTGFIDHTMHRFELGRALGDPAPVTAAPAEPVAGQPTLPASQSGSALAIAPTTPISLTDEQAILLATPQDLAKTWRRAVRSQQVQVESAILSGLMGRVADMIRTGNVKSVEELGRTTATLASRALGSSYELWQPWFDQLEQYLDLLTANNRLKTPNGQDDLAQYQALWIKLGGGLALQ